jgi:hypothetical protein
MPRQFTCNDAGVFTETTGDAVQQFSNVEVLSALRSTNAVNRAASDFWGASTRLPGIPACEFAPLQ